VGRFDAGEPLFGGLKEGAAPLHEPHTGLIPVERLLERQTAAFERGDDPLELLERPFEVEPFDLVGGEGCWVTH